MKRDYIIVFVVVTITFSSIFLFGAEKDVSEIEKMNVPELIELLNNPNWQERDKCINYGLREFRKLDDKGTPGEFKDFEGKEEITKALIKLLEKENAIFEEWWKEYENKKGKIKFMNETMGEGYGEYLIDLVAAVISLKDSRATSTIVGSGVSSIKKTKAIVEFGEISVDPLINKFKQSYNPFVRQNVVLIFGDMVKEKKILSNDNREKVKILLIDATKDKDEHVKISSLQSLANFEDKDVVSVLKSVAKNDQSSREIKASLRGGKTGEKIKIYPVREEAEKILKQMEQK